MERRGQEAEQLLARLSQIPFALVKVTIVSYEEQIRGWMAAIARENSIERQVIQYQRLQGQIENYCNLSILPSDTASAQIFERLRENYRRLSTPDLKIAAITMRHDTPLLTRNDRDFGKIEGLRSADWTIAE